MSKRICTVYFDAEFYVQLCQAEKAEANRVIDDLNSLNVRPVVSTALIRELLNDEHRNVLEQELVQRVSRFKVSPYETDYIGWEAFPQSEEESVTGSSDLQESPDETGPTMSALGLTSEQETELKDAVEQALQQPAFSREPRDDEDFQMMSFTKEIVDNLRGQLNMDWPENPTVGDLLGMSKQLMDPSVIQRAAEQNFIPDGPFEFGSGPYKLVMGSNRYVGPEPSYEPGDSEHITSFIQHQGEIDLLQVNERDHAIIEREPKNRLAKLGLAERSFSAKSLTGTVERVRELVASRLE